jgi:hypothetical protein
MLADVLTKILPKPQHCNLRSLIHGWRGEMVSAHFHFYLCFYPCFLSTFFFIYNNLIRCSMYSFTCFAYKWNCYRRGVLSERLQFLFIINQFYIIVNYFYYSFVANIISYCTWSAFLSVNAPPFVNTFHCHTCLRSTHWARAHNDIILHSCTSCFLSPNEGTFSINSWRVTSENSLAVSHCAVRKRYRFQ